MYTLLFVDDHPLYREGVRRALRDALPTLAIHVASGVQEALTTLQAHPETDLCLSDFTLGDGDGLALLQQAGKLHPTVARGLLCAAPTGEMAYRAEAMGCVACLSKDRDLDSLVQALQTLFEGGSQFDVTPLVCGVAGLTDKRKEILRLAAKGLSNKEISGLLGISERTVKDHWSYIFEQLGVSNRTEAVGYALRERVL